MHALTRSLLFCILLAAAPSLRAQTPTWANLDHGLGATITELNSIAFGNGLFVAIQTPLTGGTLRYATSPDGTTWTARSISTSITASGGALRVRFFDGRFLIMPVGLSNGAGVALSLTSTDGISWTSSNVGTTTTSPDEMAFGNGRVLAVGSNNYFIGSTNFTTWSGQSTGLQGAFGIQDVAFGNGRWFITTNGGGEVATSTDGVNFTKVAGLGAPGGFRVEYGDGVWFFYSQQDNAVSTDGVNFTKVVRTPNVTPGGTGTIRAVNGRFLSYGPSTFQASTDGQTWTNFGAMPSLGSGFVFHSIYDFAYGNGKYVAVGSRGFPATAALIFVSAGGGNEPDPGATGSFTLAFRLGVTPLPGTTTPVTGNLQGYALHQGGVLIATPNSADTQASLLLHKNGALSTLRDGTGGMPGGGNIQMLELASDGTVAYATPRSTEVNSASNGALLKIEAGAATVAIENSNSVINRGSFSSSEFNAPSAANGHVAFLGVRGNDAAYVFRRQGNATSVVAEAGVTPQPNGSGAGKFRAFEQLTMAADGRVFFEGYSPGNFTSADFRRGIYVEQGGALSVIVDNTMNVPGTTTKFKFQGDEPTYAVSPDGSKVIVRAGNNNYDTDTSERHGLYAYANGALTTIVDNTATVGTHKLLSIEPGVIANDGTVFFTAGGMHATSLYRARNGTIDLFQDGSVGAGGMNPGALVLHQNDLFFVANPSAGVTALYRKPIDGTGPATVVLNLSTHPDFKAIDARVIEGLQFANDQVLIRVGAVANGFQRSALLYGPASNVLGDSTSNPGSTAPQPQSVSAGGNATLTTSATGTLQWQRNGSSLAGSTSASLTLSNVQPTDAGIYTVTATNGSVTTSQHAIVGLSTTSKVIGTGTELEANIVHPNGNIFDQILLTGAAEAVTADHAQNQITRTSYIDLDNDIVQVEFSGPGTLSLVLDNASAPAAPVNYNQSVNYVKGHAGIVITGATEQTNVSVFSVGKATAVNQALFKDNVTYDGIADIAFIAIASSNGKFGGVRTANAHYFAAKGLTGLYAPGVAFQGPVYLGDITAASTATPVLIIGSASDTRITGGNLDQDNDAAVEVDGLTQLKFTAGGDSHGNPLAAQANAGVLKDNGVDVTTQVVVNP